MLSAVKTATTSYNLPTRMHGSRSSSPSWSSGMTRSDLTRNPDARGDAGASSAAASRRGKRRVLVVDDEKDLVDLISYNLARGGFEVLTAYDGKDALELAQREVPDLVVLDLMLPGLDG